MLQMWRHDEQLTFQLIELLDEQRKGQATEIQLERIRELREDIKTIQFEYAARVPYTKFEELTSRLTGFTGPVLQSLMSMRLQACSLGVRGEANMTQDAREWPLL
eukprot:1492458-Rhodomonas_salina.1